MNRSWLSNLFPVRRRTPITRKPTQRVGLKVQTLEDRTVPSTFTVTNLYDVGIVGSLRWAISQANTNEGDDTIAFDGSFDTETPQIITLNGTQLGITDKTGTTTIQGPSVGVTIDAQGASRVFAVFAGASAVFDGLTITGGNLAEVRNGGGVHNAGRLTISNSTILENNAIEGGGVYNKGTITISNSTIMDNLATAGGGVSNDGTMSIDRSTIMGNRAISNSINITPLGGGLLSNDGAITITNSTINNNLVEDSTPERPTFGGGVMNFNGSLTIINSTISGNAAQGIYGVAGGIYFNQLSGDEHLSMINNTISENMATVNRDMRLFSQNNVTILNTIVAGNYPSGNYGIFGAYTGSNNILGGDAKLGPLQDNGGPTHTMALLEGSPAINAGMSADGYTTDQRGYGRDPFRIDIGAYEWGATQPPAIVAPSSTFVYDDESTTLNGLGVVLDNSVHLSAALIVEHGTLSLGSGSVLTDLDPMPNGVIILGPIKQLNAALKTIQYLGRLGETSTDKLSIEVKDLNYNRVETSVMISIYSLPTLTAPERQTTYVHEDLLIDGISIEGGAPGNFTVTLNVNQGTLNVDTTNIVVNNNGTGSVTLTGTSANLNTALATLVYTGNSAGSDTLTISATDSGSKNAESTVSITIHALPTLTVPGDQTAYEDVDLPIDGISVNGGALGDMTVTLSTGHGTLTLGSTAGLEVIDNGAGFVTLKGSSADINAALATLTYRGSLNFSGSDTLSITAIDSGGKQVHSTIAINVLSVADQLEILRKEVLSLHDDGTLNKGQTTALLASLNLKGNNGDFGKLQSFINKVNDFLLEGILTQEQADSLRTKGENLLLGMTRR